jgi:dsDNA-specific endonuclease/ATPase MutS2
MWRKKMIDQKVLITLGYDTIKEEIKKYTASQLGKTLVDKMLPQTLPPIIMHQYDEAIEADMVIREGSGLNLGGISDITPYLNKVRKGMCLQPEELLKVADFMRCIRQLKKSVQKYEYTAPILYSYATGLESFKAIESDIEYAIEGSMVHSRASRSLEKVRNNIASLHGKRLDKLNKFLAADKNAKHIQENYYSQRDERYVIPIKASSKKFVAGTVIDASSSGATVYIEIDAIKDLTIEIVMLKAQETEICYQILCDLTERINLIEDRIVQAVHIVGKYDFIMAKAKYAASIHGRAITITDDEVINLKKARHPLLGPSAVPLDILIGETYRTLVITGPNTGGKTITLKTVGLISLMVQSGILPPVGEGSKIAIFNKWLIDIGDQQSITQSLSTFSGHMTSLVEIIKASSRRCLVLIDEIGTGTDPRDGAALGIAILEELYNRGAITLSSTHYGKIKEYSEVHEGFMNASMDFDRVTLSPLYQLRIGIAGESHALWISKELGLSDHILDRVNAINSTHTILPARKVSKFSKKKDRLLPLKKAETIQEETTLNLAKGDLVIHNETGEKYLVYEHRHQDKIVVLFKDGIHQEVNEKRVTLDKRAEVLYPLGYDLEQLFVSFKKRQLEKNIKKGRFKDLKALNEQLNTIK